MNIEDYRDFCLSLGADVEEKFPFTAFRYANGVLVFYVCGHMFSFFDCDSFSVITLKCQPERIPQLREQYSCIGKPFNESAKYWIGIDPSTAPDALLRDLTRNSYEIVRNKYNKKETMQITVEDFDKVDVRIGTIVAVDINKKARHPAYKLTVDLCDELGTKTSSAQITDLYTPEQLVGQQAVFCVNLAPMHIGSVKSEVRILGSESEGGVVLLQPSMAVKNGDRIF